MSSKQKGTTWEADPHTIAKIKILRGYLAAWFPILGRGSFAGDLCYIDGFCGPGQYTNYQSGSPLCALEVAAETIEKLGNNWNINKISFFFFDDNENRISYLENLIQPYRSNPKFEITTLNLTFEKGVEYIKKVFPGVFTSGSPLFAFIDPFGATGVPFEIIENLLLLPRSEILLNLDADGIARIQKAGKDSKNKENLLSIFGDDTTAAKLTESEFNRLCIQVLNVYRAKLRKIPKVKYTYPFEMRSDNDALNYFLLFASQHPLGLEKMKEAMRAIDQTGQYCFSDANINQVQLIKFDCPELYGKKMHAHFLGKKVRWSDIVDFSLNETPFPNPKGMLKLLENDNLVLVTSSDAKRRRSTYAKPELISHVEFLQGSTDG